MYKDMKNVMKSLMLMAGVVVLVACGGKEQAKPMPVAVKTETVGPGLGQNNRTYVGVVEEESSTAVSFTSAGLLSRVCVTEGQHVAKGQLIAEIDKTQATNALHAAEAQHKQAADALARMKQLHDNASLPDIKWVEAQSKMEQAQAQLDLARKNLADCAVYSPVSGVVGKGVKSAGETALPAMPVANILNINTVKIKVAVPEKEIAAISATTPTRISVEALGAEFEGGRIDKGVEADPISHTYDIKVNMANPGGKLLPGMVCNVEVKAVASAQSADAPITLPLTAVQQAAGGSKFVWKKQGNKAHRQQVTTGQSCGNRIEILQGVVAGDVVIVEGYHRLSEGTEVK